MGDIVPRVADYKEIVMTQTENPTTSQPRLFNPNDHVMQLKSREGAKDYLPVQWRLVWFLAPFQR